MTATQAIELTAFIVDPTERARMIDRLIAGAVFVCPDCQQIVDTNAGCWVCDEACFVAQAAEYDRLLVGQNDKYALRADCNAYGY